MIATNQLQIYFPFFFHFPDHVEMCINKLHRVYLRAGKQREEWCCVILTLLCLRLDLVLSVFVFGCVLLFYNLNNNNNNSKNKSTTNNYNTYFWVNFQIQLRLNNSIEWFHNIFMIVWGIIQHHYYYYY